MKTAQWLTQRNYKILFHNVEVQGVQVDLLARDSSGLLVLIEVKKRSAVAHLSGGQRARLFRVGRFLSGWEPIEVILAISDGQKVDLLPVDALTAW